MDQYRSGLKVSENFERHWSIPFPGEIHMDQSLVHAFSWGNSYGPMVLKVFSKVSPYTGIGPWMALPSVCLTGGRSTKRALIRQRVWSGIELSCCSSEYQRSQVNARSQAQLRVHVDTKVVSVLPQLSTGRRSQNCLSVPWSLRPQNGTAAATCGRGRCERPAILRLTPKIASG